MSEEAKELVAPGSISRLTKISNVRESKYGQTAQFWLSYMDLVWLISILLKATKTDDLDLHIAALNNLYPLLFAFDHDNYARYLSVSLMTLMNLNTSHPGSEDLLRQNRFSVCRSTEMQLISP